MSILEEYLKLTPNSRRIYARASKVFPSGSTRAPFFYKPYPVYMVRAQGCRIWDVDGREYIDYVNNMGPLILGHRHPKVVEAVKAQMDSYWMGAPSELEIELAEKILDAFPCMEKIQFAPSGTEAVMNVVRALRAFTGKDKIIMFEGAFHGTSDSVYPVGGIPKDLAQKIILVPFNNFTVFEEVLKKNKDDLAMVLVEPILNGHGGIPPRNGFLKAIRELTETYGIPLAFDEIVTGFRLGRGGAQERFGVKPDMIALGKIIGGGFPLAAYAGTEEVMKAFSYPKINSIEVGAPKIPHGGTYNEHKVAIAAGLATLSELNQSVYEHLENVGQAIRNGLKEICNDLKIKAQVTGLSSMFHIHFTDEDIVDARTARTGDPLLIRYYDLGMLNHGINLAKAHSSFCSTPMGKEEVETTLNAMRETLESMRNLIRDIAPALVMNL
ncbi:MAG: aminotransferase class III-fold pyridoxal phosphate-dependent enzyme [Candidatus Bathyarchaeia archaeon]